MMITDALAAEEPDVTADAYIEDNDASLYPSVRLSDRERSHREFARILDDEGWDQEEYR